MRKPWFVEHVNKLVRTEVRAELRRILGAAEPNGTPVRRKRRRKRKTIGQLAKELKIPKRRSPPTGTKSRAAVHGSARQVKS